MMLEDPLKFLPMEKWSGLQELFKADQPRSIIAFMVLEKQKLLIENGLDYGFKVFCPFGDVRNGMVAMNVKNTFYEVIIQCSRDDTTELEDALKSTSILDWSKEINIHFLPEHVANCVKRVALYKNLRVQTLNSTTYVLDKSSPLFNVTLPKGFSFDLMPLEYADFVASTWPLKYPGCCYYFELEIKAKMGYGLFKGGKLMSWVFIRETGPLLHLYTIQEERRRGYGELVLKLISNILFKDGKHVVAICIEGNINASKLYEKLNFQKTIDLEWCTLKK